ncbi:MAG: dephospho-CoA kinase [Bacteroidetes bacterium]|nr:dephospho-CoA kinase [Bacteroidota bacterium]
MIIGLTGGIGSGKTIVSKLFDVMGCAIYNSDDRAKELYYTPAVKKAVIDLLGKEAYINDQQINTAFISKKVFSDTNTLHSLNAIIHPAVKYDFTEYQTKHHANTLIIKESALLFETGIYKDLKKTILVTAPLDRKLERVMKRNHISKEEVEKRMQAQWPDEQKIPLADFVIQNDDKSALIPQVIHIIETIKSHA